MEDRQKATSSQIIRADTTSATTYRLVSLNDNERNDSKVGGGQKRNQPAVTYLVMNSNNQQTPASTEQSQPSAAKIIINNSREPLPNLPIPMSGQSAAGAAANTTSSSSNASPSRNKQTTPKNEAADPAGGSGSIRNPRDDARRRQHNEVERRRRDKINTWITKLAKIVPDCNEDHNKSSQSKGAILCSAYDHILNLQRDNEELVKKINAMPQIPLGATADEAVNIRLQAMEKEIHRLNTELKQAYDDRDDIIEQLKNQGITLATRPEDAEAMDQHRMDEDQRMQDAQELQRRIEAEHHRQQQQQQQQQDDTDGYLDKDSSNTVRITSSSNGVVVIGAGNEFE